MTFGSIRRLPSGRLQARYLGPDGIRYPAPVTFDKETYARDYLDGVHVDIQRGRWVSPNAPKPAEPATLRAYTEQWMAGRTKLAARTRHEYEGILRRHILPSLGDTPLPAVTPSVVRGWHAGLATGPTAKAAAYSLLRTILSTAVADELLTANPCRVVGAGSVKRARTIRPATLAELDAIVAALPPRHRLLAVLTAWTALRFGEVTELRAGDVDAMTGILRVRRGVVWVGGKAVVKTPKSVAGIRDVAVPPHVLTPLLAHLEGKAPKALLFPAAGGGHLPPSSLRTYWVPAVTSAGRPDLRFHDLRHTGATLAAGAGATLAELMARLGHSTPSAALRYQHAAAGRDRIIADRLSELAGG